MFEKFKALNSDRPVYVDLREVVALECCCAANCYSHEGTIASLSGGISIYLDVPIEEIRAKVEEAQRAEQPAAPAWPPHWPSPPVSWPPLWPDAPRYAGHS